MPRIEWSGIKNLKVDLTYGWSVRTIWGKNGGKNGFAARPTSMDGEDIFANISYKSPVGLLTAYYYWVDEESAVAALRRNSSDSYGARLAGSCALSKTVKWGYTLVYARQVDGKANPIDYTADYLLAEGSLDIAALKLGASVERLGADQSVRIKARPTLRWRLRLPDPHRHASKIRGLGRQIPHHADAGYQRLLCVGQLWLEEGRSVRSR